MAALSEKWLISGAILAAVLLVWGASIYVENKSARKSDSDTCLLGDMMLSGSWVRNILQVIPKTAAFPETGR